MAPTQVMMELVMPATVRKKGKRHIASCPLLDVHSQGHTAAEANRNLVEGLVEFLLSCFERGTLNQVLSETGFVPVGEPAKHRVPSAKHGREKPLLIPLPFLIRAQRGHRPAGGAVRV